jgi:hypothetical protein
MPCHTSSSSSREDVAAAANRPSPTTSATRCVWRPSGVNHRSQCRRKMPSRRRRHGGGGARQPARRWRGRAAARGSPAAPLMSLVSARLVKHVADAGQRAGQRHVLTKRKAKGREGKRREGGPLMTGAAQRPVAHTHTPHDEQAQQATRRAGTHTPQATRARTPACGTPTAGP